MSLLSDRDKNLLEAIRKFFKDRTLPGLEGEKNNKPRRQKLQSVRLSNPKSKAGLMKVMNKVGAKNLLQVYSTFAKK